MIHGYLPELSKTGYTELHWIPKTGGTGNWDTGDAGDTGDVGVLWIAASI